MDVSQPAGNRTGSIFTSLNGVAKVWVRSPKESPVVQRSIMAPPTNSENRDDEVKLAEAIRRRFAPFGGVQLELPPGEPAPQAIESADDPEEDA